MGDLWWSSPGPLGGRRTRLIVVADEIDDRGFAFASSAGLGGADGDLVATTASCAGLGGDVDEGHAANADDLTEVAVVIVSRRNWSRRAPAGNLLGLRAIDNRHDRWGLENRAAI